LQISNKPILNIPIYFYLCLEILVPEPGKLVRIKMGIPLKSGAVPAAVSLVESFVYPLATVCQMTDGKAK